MTKPKAILISWLAKKNDFAEGQVNPQGPNVSFHQHFYQHKKHIILSSEPGDDFRLELLENYLKLHYDHEVEGRYMDVLDILDLYELKGKIESLLLEYQEEEVDIFFSPGNSVMQLCWYICHTNLGLNTRILQTRRAAETQKQEKDELLELLTDDFDPTPHRLMLRKIINRGIGQKIEEPKEHYIGKSLQPVYNKALQIAQADQVSVLIQGPSGTGKEHLARYIHQHSPRNSRKLRSINCAALSDELLSSTLFGHVKGAYTTAINNRKGWFEEANGGTLFLDEIGDISPFMQQSLLRALQEGEIVALGSNTVRKVDVRIIAATNKNLRKKIKEGSFREDLYYRLAEVSLDVPALQERGIKEKMALFQHLLITYQHKFHKTFPLVLTEPARLIIEAYPFPGNIREMESLIKSLYVFCEMNIRPADLPRYVFEIDEADKLDMKSVEKRHILKVLKIFNGNLTHTTEALGWSRNTLMDRLRRFEISAESFK